MDPTWVATGLKVELDTLVVECKLVSDRIGEIISLDGENDNKVTSFAEFSNEFEETEFSWKGCVKSIQLKKEFAKVDEAAEALYIVSLPHDPHEMKVITSYLLAVLGGNVLPSAKDLKGILGSVGVDHDNDMIEHLLTQVKGKDIMELITAGREKLASVPSGGGVVQLLQLPLVLEVMKEEKVVQKEESDDDMCFGLFD
ncbi:hypothetical protein ACS0TY_004654 [Phlomoides rotata]